MLFHIIFTAVVLFDIHIYPFVALIFKILGGDVNSCNVLLRTGLIAYTFSVQSRF